MQDSVGAEAAMAKREIIEELEKVATRESRV